MKFVILLSVLIFAAGINYAVMQHHEYISDEINQRQIVQLNSLDAKQEPNPTPYSFHYAGKEVFNNVYSTYRLNKESGEILKYSYTSISKDKDGTPQFDLVSVLNMETGEQDSEISDLGMAALRAFRLEEAEKKANKEKNK